MSDVDALHPGHATGQKSVARMVIFVKLHLHNERIIPRIMTNKLLPILMGVFLCYGITAQNPSTIKEYKKPFKTYGFSDPDPIARMGAVYPYYRFDGYTDKPVNKDWKVVELENDFIRVMVLPEIGGKIWGAWEKGTGKSFVYYNQVVKFRDIAMRGPWTSGGIEANYGIIGHTPNTATPVDYSIEKKDDGSVSCYIGTLDLLTQTYWTIEINLPRDKAYFTTRSFWYNSTPLEQPYYTWMNTGIKVAGNLEFVYPGNRFLGHGGELGDWKINGENGKDISFYENNNFGGYKSYHVFGKYTDFFGAYYHKENFGMGRYAAHDEKAGKKIWIWGLSQQGMIWDKLLTDTDGQYAEIQSGRLFNQTGDQSTYTPFKHRGFAPSVSDTWTEYWFPVKDTKGFVQANPYGALNVRVSNGYLKLDFMPLQELKAELKVMENDLLVYSKTVSLKTLKVSSDSVKFNGNPDNLTVTLGENKLRYSSNPKDGALDRPVELPNDFNWKSAYGLYILGKENIRERYYALAEENLKACLTVEPNYLPALADLSMLMYRNMEYQKSLDYARKALSIDTYDPQSNFYYGLVHFQLGNLTDAKDGFDIAAQSGEYRSAAYVELSKVYLKESDFSKALIYAGKSLESNAGNVQAYQVAALAHRLSGDKEKAMTSIGKLNGLNPLNHFNRYEEYRLLSSEASKSKFTSMIRNEMPHESYLQLADWYLSIGLEKESLEVLKLAPVNPEVLYWMAYLKRNEKGGESKLHIDKANAITPELVFPFRSSSARVLEWVIAQTPRWEPKYYLGLIYWSKNNLSRAKELFAQCGSPDFSPFYAAMASLMNDDNTVKYLKKAAEINPNQWRYGRLLFNYYVEKKNYAEALATAKQYHAWFPQDFRITMLLAKANLLNKQYKACTDLLAITNILPYEGATDGRQLLREAWMMQAVQQVQGKNYKGALVSVSNARQWPENLGAGKPYDADLDTRLESYLEGISLERMKDNGAGRKWIDIMAWHESEHGINTLVTALALNKLNRAAEGEKLLNDWLQKAPSNAIAKWCMDAYHGNAGDLDGDDNYRILKALQGAK